MASLLQCIARMTRTLGILLVAALAAWLGGHARANAQTRCDDETLARLPDLPVGDTTTCARVGRRLLGVTATLGETVGESQNDVTLGLATETGALEVSLVALRTRFGAGSLGWSDALDVSISRLAPGIARVAIITHFGEDYGSALETIVIVRVGRTPRVLWAGDGSYEQSDYFVCLRRRTVTVRLDGDVLRVRSRVMHAIAPEGSVDGASPELHRQLAAACVSPPRVTVDRTIDLR